jgi:hypothetical protein
MALDQPGRADARHASGAARRRRCDTVRLGRRSFLAWLAMSAAARGPDHSTGYDWQGVSRVVAIGDVHGDKDALTAVLSHGRPHRFQ